MADVYLCVSACTLNVINGIFGLRRRRHRCRRYCRRHRPPLLFSLSPFLRLLSFSRQISIFLDFSSRFHSIRFYFLSAGKWMRNEQYANLLNIIK